MSEVITSPHPTGPHGVCKENLILFVFTRTVLSLFYWARRWGQLFVSHCQHTILQL